LIPLPLALDWAKRHREAAKKQWAGSDLIDRMLDTLWRVLSQELDRRKSSK
jgi:hypothetical protein